MSVSAVSGLKPTFHSISVIGEKETEHDPVYTYSEGDSIQYLQV